MKTVTELIDRYVERVEDLLPSGMRRREGERVRAEVVRRAAERSGRAPQEVEAGRVPEEDVLAVLREMGEPGAVAAAARPRGDWLIAPYLMPRFVTAAAISLAALVVTTLVGVWTGPGGVTGEEGGVGDLLLRLVASLDDLLLKAVVVLAGLVGLFVFMDRAVEAGQGARREEGKGSERGERGGGSGWDPRSLLTTRGPDGVELGGTALSLALLTVALAWVNAFPGVVGGSLEVGGERGAVLLQLPWIRRELVWIDLWLVGLISRDAVLLYRGRWTPALRWADVALTGLLAFVLWRVVGGGPLLGVDAEWMLDHGWSRDAIERSREALLEDLDDVVRMVLRWILVFIPVFAVVEIYRAIRTTLRHLRRS